MTLIPTSSRGVSGVDPLAAAAGFDNWNGNTVTFGAGASSMTSQTAYAMAIWLPGGTSVSNVDLLITTAAAGTAPTGAFVAIADTVAIRAQSGNIAGAAGWAAGSIQPFAIGSTFVTPSAGIYYAIVLVNGTWGTTQPAFARGGFGGTPIRLGANPFLFATVGTGIAALPANGTALVFTSSGALNFFAGFS